MIIGLTGFLSITIGLIGGFSSVLGMVVCLCFDDPGRWGWARKFGFPVFIAAVACIHYGIYRLEN